MKKNIIYLTILGLLILIFKNYNIVLESSITAVNLWLYKVFPFLFIMIIINDLLINLDFQSLFKNTSIYIFMMSLLSGSPTSAVIICNLYKNNKITKNNANITLLFTYFANPLFLWTILNSIFNSKITSIKLILIHYISNLIIYFIVKKKLDKSIAYNNKININISSSIKKAMTTTTMVLGAIAFYLIISNILSLNLLFKGLLEMTQGLNALINYNSYFKELLAILFISFGGLSIHTQVKCILDEENISYKYFLKGRIMQTLIALGLTILTSAWI